MRQNKIKRILLKSIYIVLLTLIFAGFTACDSKAFFYEEEQQPSPGTPSLQPGSTTVYLPLISTASAAAAASPSSPRVNIPYFDQNVTFEETSIFWLGRITPSENYTDVRIAYTSSGLWVFCTTIDHSLKYTLSPVSDQLTLWDSASLYLDLDGNTGNTLTSHDFRFDGQLDDAVRQRSGFQAAYHGSNSSWVSAALPFITATGYRSNGTSGDSGWTIKFEIPYTSLGLSGPPSKGSIWRLGVAIHDRDSEAGPPNPDKIWPPSMVSTVPSTWGQVHFGLPVYTPPGGIAATNTVDIRNKLNGAVVKDGMVGGSTICGYGFQDYWTQWGQANYVDSTKANVQNQFDVSDWPCFSKFYITFPLDQLPEGKRILSSTLTLHMFGNAGGGQYGPAPNSLIQVFTVGDNWDASTLNWNNAPLALENVSRAWVQPITGDPGAYGVPRQWDLSYAVDQAYRFKMPLRLAIYSADFSQHTGKYFNTSSVGDWGEVSRPTLEVILGSP